MVQAYTLVSTSATSNPAALSPFLEMFNRVIVDEKTMPSPMQKVGIGVNHQRIESPKSAVDGMFYRTKTTSGMIPPKAK